MVDETVIEISVKGRWVAVPAILVHGYHVVTTGKWMKVASVHDEWWIPSEVEHPGAIIERLRKAGSGLKADVFTFSQRLTSLTPRYSYPMEPDSVAAIRLTTFAQWWESLPQATRKNARKAAKRGVVTTIKALDDDLVRQIVELNNESPLRQGAPFTHFGKSFDQVKRDHSSFEGRSEFICAHLENELIGFLRIVYCDGIANILQLTTKGSHFDKKPANVLLEKAVERCEQKGIGFITYGKYRYGNQGMTSLMEFKMRNGFEEIMVPRYYIPLTLKGRIGMKLKLHRDLVGLLPPSAITAAREARARWYGMKRGAGEKSEASASS